MLDDADKGSPDATLELAKVVGVAIAAGTVDRDELFEIAHRVVDGPDRYAQRLGFVVAVALIDALQAVPRVAPSTEDAPLAIEDRRKVVGELHGEGLSNGRIANVLGVSSETVRRDVRAMPPLRSSAAIAASDVSA